jgi:hypothetical protein
MGEAWMRGPSAEDRNVGSEEPAGRRRYERRGYYLSVDYARSRKACGQKMAGPFLARPFFFDT